MYRGPPAGSAGEDLLFLLRELLIGEDALLVELAELPKAIDGLRAHASSRASRRGSRRLLALEVPDPLVLVGLFLLRLGVALAHYVGATAYRRGAK